MILNRDKIWIIIMIYLIVTIVYSSYTNQDIELQQIQRRQLVQTIGTQYNINHHTSAVKCATFSRNSNNMLITTGQDKKIFIYDITDLNNPVIKKTFIEHSQVVNTAFFSYDEKYIITASNDQTSLVIDIQSNVVTSTFIGHTNKVTSANLSPDNLYAVTSSLDYTIKIWDVATSQVIRTLTQHTHNVNYVEYSPDQTMIVSASDDNTAKIWDPVSGAVLKDITSHTDRVTHASFSQDNQKIVTSSWDQNVLVINIGTLNVDFILGGHQNIVKSAHISYDNKYIISSSADGTQKLWNGETGSIIRTYIDHIGQVNYVTFSYDKAYFVSAGQDNSVKIYSINCAFGTYLEEISQTCLNCTYKCKNCSEFTVCTECNLGNNRTTNIPDCECEATYYDTGTELLDCQKCVSPCLECTTQNTCLSCVENYYFDEVEKTCNECVFPCLTCTSELNCLTCLNDDLMNDGELFNCTCIDGYEVQNAECVKIEEPVEETVPPIEKSWFTTTILIIFIVVGVLIIATIITLYFILKHKRKLKIQQILDERKRGEDPHMQDNPKDQKFFHQKARKSIIHNRAYGKQPSLIENMEKGQQENQNPKENKNNNNGKQKNLIQDQSQNPKDKNNNDVNNRIYKRQSVVIQSNKNPIPLHQQRKSRLFALQDIEGDDLKSQQQSSDTGSIMSNSNDVQQGLTKKNQQNPYQYIQQQQKQNYNNNQQQFGQNNIQGNKQQFQDQKQEKKNKFLLTEQKTQLGYKPVFNDKLLQSQKQTMKMNEDNLIQYEIIRENK